MFKQTLLVIGLSFVLSLQAGLDLPELQQWEETSRQSLGLTENHQFMDILISYPREKVEAELRGKEKEMRNSFAQQTYAYAVSGLERIEQMRKNLEHQALEEVEREQQFEIHRAELKRKNQALDAQFEQLKGWIKNPETDPHFQARSAVLREKQAENAKAWQDVRDQLSELKNADSQELLDQSIFIPGLFSSNGPASSRSNAQSSVERVFSSNGQMPNPNPAFDFSSLNKLGYGVLGMGLIFGAYKYLKSRKRKTKNAKLVQPQVITG